MKPARLKKAGLTYAARMNLNSKSLDEKIIYSLIGAEEALHLKSLEPFLGEDAREEMPSFAGLIHQWIHKLERPSLLVMIQILLEGWGLGYYQSLAQSALDPRLQAVFAQILQDESRHHATGVILYRHETLQGEERERLEQELLTLFQCVQVGPQQAAVELALASGKKTVDFAKLLSEMDAVADTTEKLGRLQKLLEKNRRFPFVRDLLGQRSFHGLFVGADGVDGGVAVFHKFKKTLREWQLRN